MDAALTDMIVSYGSQAAGQAVASLGVPARALIVLISRGDKYIVPNGSTVIEEGDVLLVLAPEKDRKTLQAIIQKGKK